MDKKIIDTSTVGKDGITMIIDFDNVSAPFLVVVTDEITGKTLYYRYYDKKKLTFNLPVYNKRVKLFVSGNTKIKSVLLTKLKKPNYEYKFNHDIIMQRPYPIEQIKVETLPLFLGVKNGKPYEITSPARFLPSEAKIQFSAKQTANIPEPLEKFCRYHEEGHYYYGRPYMTREQLAPLNFTSDVKNRLMQQFAANMLQDEKEADRYALYKFLNEGYNFSGSLFSLLDFLPQGYANTQRILSLHDEIKKIHQINEL